MSLPRLRTHVLPCLILPCWLAGCSPADPTDGAASAPTSAVQREGALAVVPPASPLRKSLVVETAQNGIVEQPISAPGSVEALPDHLVKITSPVTGRVERLHRALGDAVRKGDALFTLDSSDLSTAYGDAAKARASLQQAGRDLERQKLLLDADIAARKDFEAAQLAYNQAESDAQVTQARLAQLGASNASARRQFVLRSPINGRVIDMSGAQGGYWNDITAPLMTVADLSTVAVTAAVAEKDLAAVFVGQKARILLNAYPGEPINGEVRYVGEVLDVDTRTVKVRLLLDNHEGKLRPGMFAKVVFSGASHPAILVPATAVLQSGLFTRVFVEKAPFKFEARQVTVGASMGDRVEILSGLKAGERIVVKEGVLLND
ncbi:efflux RND transporter periplasmic adaptor subunit [Roseateles sp.]|uniref:efflux RND transporter periplasmic adaptor subunit n=1 Tax=Roseateles sp. TaxID=1971397 RepID=UPI0025F873AC|nr:efflux RND transporter periplasmic adaptor subunit [Roseateles sp.]MBV8036550.1 efflux RND transporter periplasmic adaptor subunit [Roseateles sp.]